MSDDYQLVSILLKNEILYICPKGKTNISSGLRVFNGDLVDLTFDTSPGEMVDSIKKALESSSVIVEEIDFRFSKMDSMLLQRSGCKSLKSFYEKIKLVNILYSPTKSAFVFSPQKQVSKGSFREVEGKSISLDENADDVSIVMALKEALSISE